MSSIEQVVPVREVPLVGGMSVRRILPYRARRLVGPFAFLDEMGPIDLGIGNLGDVPPHPHIGLSTVTYLFDGEIEHRDSLGTIQTILPGDVNWMTAGRGIVHSERIRADLRRRGTKLHGLQAWIALPVHAEGTEPRFAHFAKERLAAFDKDGVSIRLIAGSAFGQTSPVKTESNLFYFIAEAPEARNLRFSTDGQEGALYLVSGQIIVDQQTFDAPAMIVFKRGETIDVAARKNSRLAFFGGEPFPEQRFIDWNFVASSRDKIEAAKKRWAEQGFPRVPGETEFVPLPS